jgi:hypothetical protein
MRKPLFFLLIFINLFLSPTVIASDAANSPWGVARVTETEYKPQKVVYDVNADTVELFEGVLSRASYLSTITGADPFDQSIVLVLHGPEIALFGIKNHGKHKELMQRAHSLVDSEVLTIRMCKVAAEAMGYQPEDIHGFVDIIPMGDAEIIRLQNEEDHAYMQ